jgi:hypothetical protein
MILKPFLSNQTFVLILLLPVLAGFCLLNWYFPYHTLFEQVDLGLWGKSDWLGSWWISIFSALIVGLNGLQLNTLFNRHEFLERNNYGPSLFYVTLMSFSHSFYQPDGLLVVHICWVQVLRLLFRVRSGEDARKEVTNAAFFVGLAASFHPASGGLLLLFWFALWAMKPFDFREWILSMIGFAAPVVNALIYWWYSGHRIDSNLLRYDIIVEHEAAVYYSTSALMLILFLLSIIGIRIRVQKSSIRYKKLNRALMWILLGGMLLGTADILFYQQIEWFNFIFISLSFFFTFAFIHKFWKGIATFFFYATFLLAIAKFFLQEGLLG